MTSQGTTVSKPATPGDSMADALRYVRDDWPIAAKWSSAEVEALRPESVRKPRSTEDILAIMAEARASGTKVVAFGAGSGVCGASIPKEPAIVIDMGGVNQIFELDEEGMTVTVGAGIMGGELEGWLNARGYTCGHYPQSLHVSTVGGWMGTRGIGTFSNKYGAIEDLVYGAEVALANGSTVSFGRAPRSAAGPWLLELFLGSEGTLGIITKVTLRIFALPEKRAFAAYRFASLDDGLASVRRMYQRHYVPTLARLYDKAESEHVYEAAGVDAAGNLLILGHEGHPALVDAEAETADEITASFGGTALGPAIGETWSRGRYRAVWLEANEQPHVVTDSIEVSTKWQGILPLYHDVMNAIEPLVTSKMAHMSHFYSTGTMIYFIFAIDDPDVASLRSRYESVWRIVTEAALRHGGTSTHHHGVGLARRSIFEREVGQAAIDILKGIKVVVDPDSILNPGKLAFD